MMKKKAIESCLWAALVPNFEDLWETMIRVENSPRRKPLKLGRGPGATQAPMGSREAMPPPPPYAENKFHNSRQLEHISWHENYQFGIISLSKYKLIFSNFSTCVFMLKVETSHTHKQQFFENSRQRIAPSLQLSWFSTATPICCRCLHRGLHLRSS